jgi:uncharacterized protein
MSAEPLTPWSAKESVTTTLVRQKLSDLLEMVPAISGAFLATDDGFELTHVVSGNELEPARLAALCSSMVALSHALVGEIAFGETTNLVIEAKHGKVLLLTIDRTPKLSLTVIAKPSATLGQVLVHSKVCAGAILAILDAQG